MDIRLVPPNLLEDIYASEIDENLPFEPGFDDYAEQFLLSPGDVAVKIDLLKGDYEYKRTYAK